MPNPSTLLSKKDQQLVNDLWQLAGPADDYEPFVREVASRAIRRIAQLVRANQRLRRLSRPIKGVAVLGIRPR